MANPKANFDIVAVITLGILGGVFGFLASQLFPFWGGVLQNQQTLAREHIFVFSILGIAFGLVYNYFEKKKNKY